MKNAKWQRDELILALDLYFELEPWQIHVRNPAIIELFEILNALPFSEAKTDAERYCNPNGIWLELSNFLAIAVRLLRETVKDFKPGGRNLRRDELLRLSKMRVGQSG